MANNHTTLTSLFVDIADAIRAKKNSTESIVADTFPIEIINLRTGFDYNNHNATSISDYEFYNCADLNNVNCYSLTSIGTSAFEGCENLKTAILYDGVTSVGANAFKGCSDVIIYCEVNEKPDTWDDNWNPDGCEVVWGFAPIKTWDVSATENDNVTAKLYSDISNEGMYQLVVGGSGNMNNYNGSTQLWRGYRQNINSAIILADVTNIGNSAFAYCSSLTSVIIGNSVASIGNSAFVNCSSLALVTIPDSVTNIEGQAFDGCSSLISIVIPNNVTDILYSAFTNCTSLTSVTIPDSVTSIGQGAFSKCTSLTSVTIPDSVTSIGHSAFSGCAGLTSINIPNGITSIASQTFYMCKSLTSITIPSSVISIGEFALFSTSIIYTGTIAQWNAIIFDGRWNSYNDYTIYCTDGTITKDGTITYYQTQEEVSDNG